MTMDRRSFLKLFAVSGCAAAGGVALANADRIESLLNGGEFRVAASKAAIGTHVDITAFGPSRYATEDAVQAAFEDVAGMERLLTRYDQKSPVCELNEEGCLTHLPEALSELCRVCDAYYRDTNGAFDITVAPLVDLFKAAAAEGREPTQNEIAEVTQRMGASKISWNGAELALAEGTQLTFDGCAPGLIADRAAAVLERRGIRNYLVNAGGEIRTSGHPKNAEKWRIAIQDPAKQGNYPGFLAFNAGAVSTSGNYEIYYGEDRLYHHIVDARNGRSPNALTSVTVTAPTALEADILSTALFVMSPAESLAYVARHPNVACLLITRSGERITSPNFVMA